MNKNITDRPPSSLEFEKCSSCYFNSASIGLEVKTHPKPTQPDSNKCPLCDVDPASNGPEEKAQERVGQEEEFDWDEAVSVVQHKFGKLIGKPSQTISVFHNTTAGVQRILLRLSQLFGSSEPTLLLSDLEYPGIVSAVDEMWPGRLIMVQVADSVWKGQAERITNKLMNAIVVTRPSVVYLSHIARSTGYRIDEQIVDFVRSAMPSTIIILDGAQACGNIHIDSTLLSKVDFYVTSGHKWLCGTPTLGLVYSEEKWQIHDPAQSYSMTRVPTGTGSKSVILSLQKALCDFNGESTGQSARARMNLIEEHNAELAKDFCRKVKSKGLGKPLNDPKSRWKANGIATIVFDSPEIPLLMERQKLPFTFFGDERWRDSMGGTVHHGRYFLNPDEKKKDRMFVDANFKQAYVPNIEGYAARFCFHYFHDLTDVNRLVSMIKKAKNQTRAQRRKNKK